MKTNLLFLTSQMWHILCSEMTSSKQSEIKNLHSCHVDSQTKHSCVTDSKVEMVFCCVVGCSNRSEKCSSKSFYRIPTVVSHHDNETQELSSERHSAWFSSIKRADIDTSASFYRVCSDHFVNGKYFQCSIKQSNIFSGAACY